MQSCRFATSKSPCCVWDWDLAGQTVQFLESFDATYFDYLVACHIPQLESEDARRAATAIRITYCHALETLFSMIGAVVQAPECVPGWLQQCRPEQLRELVSHISQRRPVYARFRERTSTWEALAHVTLWYLTFPDPDKKSRVVDGFGGLWSRLAQDFLSEHVRAEYNSLKHGLRISSGGSWLAVGQESSPGVACDPEAMKTLGGSEHGSSFFEIKKLAPLNYRLVRRSMNWDPYVLAARIQLIAMSLRNLVSFLRITTGVGPDRVQFHTPAPLELFEDVWQSTGVTSSSFATVLELEHIVPKTAEEILAVYHAAPEVEGTAGSQSSD